VRVESKVEARNHELHVEVLFEPGEAAAELEALALEFNGHTVPPLRPIVSNNPSARSSTGQYIFKDTVVQKNQQRVQKHMIVVPLDHLKLAEGIHQIAYQIRVLQGEATIEHVCAPLVFLRVEKAAKVTGHRTEKVTITEVRTDTQTVDISRDVDGESVIERQSITVRVPQTREVRQEIPEVESGQYADVFAAVTPRAADIDDPNIAAQVEEMQTVPWTPPRKIGIDFATNRNVVKPDAIDASRFGNEVGELSYGTAIIQISVKKTHGERPPSQEPVRPTPQDSFTVSQINALSEDSFYQAITNALSQAAGDRSKNDVVLFVHGYNNSFRFSCVRFAQLDRSSLAGLPTAATAS
jgi:hypothetical protein